MRIVLIWLKQVEYHSTRSSSDSPRSDSYYKTVKSSLPTGKRMLDCCIKSSILPASSFSEWSSHSGSSLETRSVSSSSLSDWSTNNSETSLTVTYNAILDKYMELENMIKEAEWRLRRQERKIEELEAKHEEAEDNVNDLRVELREGQSELERCPAPRRSMKGSHAMKWFKLEKHVRLVKETKTF